MKALPDSKLTHKQALARIAQLRRLYNLELERVVRLQALAYSHSKMAEEI